MPSDVRDAELFRTSEKYEYIHESGIYEVTVNYIGKDSLLDVIKAALKRKLELYHSGLKAGNADKNLD